MANEIKRLNGILQESNQSFYKLYQALREKKDRIEALEKGMQALQTEYINNTKAMNQKYAELNFENEKLKVKFKVTKERTSGIER
jgi:predicted transcriptional regulator